MSTKIYGAYHVKNTNGIQLWPFLRDLKKRADKSCHDKLVQVIEELMASVNPESDAYIEDDDRSDTAKRLQIAHDCLTKEYEKQANSHRRNPFYLDVTISIHENNDQYYLIAYCDFASLMSGSLDFMNEMEELEDFHYQNSTDKPDEISEEDWENREKVWDEIYKAGWMMQLTLDIVTNTGFFRIDPYFELCEKYKSKIEEERKKE
jgi:hypothetical protein